MASTLVAWARRLVLGRAIPAGLGPEPGSGSGSAMRLVGPPEPVNRMLVVRPGTIALLLAPGRPPELVLPGTVIAPPLFSLRLLAAPEPAVTGLVLSTRPVEVEVSVTEVVTFDGYHLDRVVLRLTLELDAEDGYAGVLDLAGQHRDRLEEALLQAVHGEVRAAVVGAVAVNRLADLQRLTLADVLRDRWLPATYGSGSLRCSAFRVERTGWPSSGEDEPTIPLRSSS